MPRSNDNVLQGHLDTCHVTARRDSGDGRLNSPINMFYFVFFEEQVCDQAGLRSVTPAWRSLVVQAADSALRTRTVQSC